jgi:capsular exopolysaccharide synthesis family protein
MSHIFDALQRSEDERSGADSPAPSEATELLRRAERRAASKWETTALVEPSVAPEGTERDTSFRPGEAPPDATAQEASSAGELSPTGGGLDIFGQFQSLQVSVAAQNRLICFTDKESPATEAFRLLAVRLRNLRRARPLRKVLITSTIPQEGKSMVAANLACILALRTRQKILLLEGDLRRPTFSQTFGLESNPGLCECLQGERALMASIYYLEDAGLWILPAGSAPGNALELLQSGRLPSLMDQLAEWFEWIIIDTPPVLPLADTSVWMRLADGVLLVTRQGTTEKRQLQRGLEAIEPKKLIGALMNCSKNSSHDSYYYRKPAVSVPNDSSTK